MIDQIVKEFEKKVNENGYNYLKKLHDNARNFLLQNGIEYDGEFYETAENEIIKFKVPHPESSRKLIQCWLKCSYLERKNGDPGLCITYGAFHPTLPQHDTKTFWMDETFHLSDEERAAIQERLAISRQMADERAKEEKKIADAKADWCVEKYRGASPQGHSPYFDRKGITPSDIRYEVRRTYAEDGTVAEETIALIPLRNISGKIQGLQEIYPTKRRFGDDPKPRDKNTNGTYTSCFFTFGKIEDGKPICLAEGYATAGSIFQSINTTTLMTVSRVNIQNVVKALKRKYPNSNITICADADPDGLKDATEAARKLKCKLAVPKFPEGRDKDAEGNSHKDFNDLMLVAGREEVSKQIEEAATFVEAEIEGSKVPEIRQIPENGLPVIRVTPGQLHVIVDLCQTVLLNNSLGLFQRGGQLVRIISEINKPKKNKLLDRNGREIIKRDSDSLLIAEVDQTYLTELLGKFANWATFNARAGEWFIRDPSEKAAKTLLARREWDFPVLSGFIRAPTLRPDGTILDREGYDEGTGLFFDAGATQFDPIPVNPSEEDALIALSVLQELLKDFPFENEESQSVALSAILTGLVRKSIRTAPLHAFTAPKMGSGKSLLCDAVGLICTGRNNSVLPQASDEAEETKRLLAVLAEGDPIICYDNVERPIESAALCAVLTQEFFKNRILGKSSNLTVPTNVLFMANGNNLTFVGDISTRALLCNLDPQCERPEERSFVMDLRAHISQNRALFVKAALTILRAYHCAGRPPRIFRHSVGLNNGQNGSGPVWFGWE